MKPLRILMAVAVMAMVPASALEAQTVTGSGDPNYIPLWISTGAGGGGIIFGTTHGDLHFSSIPSTGGTPGTISESTVQDKIRLKVLVVPSRGYQTHLKIKQLIASL